MPLADTPPHAPSQHPPKPLEITSRFGFWTGLVFGGAAFAASAVLLATLPLTDFSELPGGYALPAGFVLLVGGSSAWILLQLTRVAAAHDGVWMRRLSTGTKLAVPWHRVRHVDVLIGRGWAWRIVYRPADRPGERTFRSPYGLGDDVKQPPARLLAVRSLWEAAEGPVALEAHTWGWRLSRES